MTGKPVMTPEIARDELIGAFVSGQLTPAARGAIYLAVNALGKQIPTEPEHLAIVDNNGYIIYDCECPNCEQSHRELFPFGFCIHCGQKIDWGDTE